MVMKGPYEQFSHPDGLSETLRSEIALSPLHCGTYDQLAAQLRSHRYSLGILRSSVFEAFVQLTAVVAILRRFQDYLWSLLCCVDFVHISLSRFGL